MVSPDVTTLSADLIVIELAYVAAAVRPVELTLSVLLAIHKLALEHGSIWPLLPPIPVLVVSVELSDVLASISVNIDALAAGLALPPDALVAVTVCVNESSRSAGLPLAPEALVSRAIRP